MSTTPIKAFAVFAALLSLSCSESGAPEPADAGDAGERLQVYVVNHPLEYFAKRIGGDHVEVHLPAPGGIDPAFWSPDGETVADYQASDLVILNGAGYARWIGRSSLPREKLVDTSIGFRERWIRSDDAVTHGHGPSGEHSHAGIAFTTWLDPTLAIEQARVIADALTSRRPAARKDFERNLASLEADLIDLDVRLEKATAALRDVPLLFSHPVYEYFARRYALDGRSLHWEPDEFPDAPAWRALEASLPARPAGLLIFEGPPLQETKARLAELHIRTFVIEPTGNAPGEGNWLDAMHANAEQLEAVSADFR